ncbi:hypothetical protein [Caulobacter phage RapA]|nr:hypothetical protein [Caulobacter phage RapA]
MNQGFKELMEQMRQELKVALRERDDARAECDTHQATIEELRRTIAALRAARPANA